VSRAFMARPRVGSSAATGVFSGGDVTRPDAASRRTLSSSPPVGDSRDAKIRPEWFERVDACRRSVLNESAPTEPATTIQDLATSLPEPSSELEHTIAVDALKITAVELILRSVQRGASGHAEAFCELERIMAVIDEGSVGTLATRVRDTSQSCTPTAIAVRIRQFISANLMKHLTLPQIAKAVGCSVRTATTAFRAHHNMTIYEFLIRVRLLHATRLLVDTDLKLASIALLIGFRDKVSLHRHFLKRTGVTPMTIRKRLAGEDVVVRRLAV